MRKAYLDSREISNLFCEFLPHTQMRSELSCLRSEVALCKGAVVFTGSGAVTLDQSTMIILIYSMSHPDEPMSRGDGSHTGARIMLM